MDIYDALIAFNKRWVKLNEFSARHVYVFSALAVICFAIYIVQLNVAVSISSSLNKRVFWFEKGKQDFKKGDYVIFETMYPSDPPKQVRAVKRVGCVPGETLSEKPFGGGYFEYYCNGEYIGKSKPFSKKGKPLNRFVYEGIVPEGNAFMVGDHVDSYDSRYFGFIQFSQTFAKAHPIW